MKRKLGNKLLAGVLAAAMIVTAAPANVANAVGTEPAALDIGHPTFKNTEYLADIYDIEGLGVEYSDEDIMMAIYQADLAAGGDSFYMDRVLAREGVADGDANSNGNDDGDTFLTRGRALYMYTSNPRIIGFGGQVAYHQPMSLGNMYAITFAKDGSALSTSENSSERVNYPSNWVSSYNVGDSLVADVTKFISNENVAVTTITLKDTSGAEQAVTVNAASGYVSATSEVEINGEAAAELVGTVMSPSNLTEITTRLTGNGFAHAEDGKSLVKEVVVPANGSVELRVVMAFTTEELPESTEDYVRFSEYATNLEAVRAQKAEYNLYWAENLPYVDVPNDAIQKAIDYRWWSERFNSLDANIPGYDYQYPVTIEGVLGYNNAIVLTQSMHMQDTKWLRNPNLVYGALLSVGNSSQSSAFLDNPGNRNNWNNHYGQYIAQAGLEAFYTIGGGEELAENLAYYFGHDATGQLEHYGNHTDHDLIAYQSNYMTGNDADTISMSGWSGVGNWKIHGENAYVWKAADSAAELYALLGNDEKAAEYQTLADSIQEDVLNVLWCEQCQKFETYGVSPTKTLHNENQPNLVEWTESNNWNYFAVGLVPTDEESLEKYRPAFEAFTNGEEFPIFPYYTANQVDNDEHIAVAGYGGSNNFSNINFTVQARAYESALRTYDKEQEYITDDMLALMVEWCAWNMYPDSGDVRYPNNNEFFNIDDRTLDTYYRSWIYHNILGNYNYIFFEDMAGIVPRADEKIELSPIDFSYDHFMVNNARYHGHDLTVVWDDPTDDAEYYDGIPAGYSLYVDGALAFTLHELGHVVYDSEAGTLEFPEGEVEVAKVAATSAIPTAMDTVITEESVLEMFEKSGIHGMTNLAEGAEVEATFTPDKARGASWAEKHRADGTDPTSEAVNEMVPDPQAVTDGTTVNMPFWGNFGSANVKDSLIVKLDEAQTVDMAALYFYNDRQDAGYSEPAKFTVEYWDGTEWKHVEKQTREPEEPKANYNEVLFKAVTTDQFKFTFTNKDDNYTAVTEIQLFEEGGERPEPAANTAPTVELSIDSSKVGNLRSAVEAKVVDDGKPYDADTTYVWEVVGKPSEEAIVILGASNKPSTSVSASEPGTYTLKFTVNDGELEASETISVTLEANSSGGGLGEDVAPNASDVESDYTASWEKLSGINNTAFEPASSNTGTGKGWGNWPQDPGSEHYVGYIWNDAVTVGGLEVYWYDDGGGTRIPASFRVEYKDANGDWQEANVTTPYESAIALDTYNTIYFDAVTTTNLRFYVTVHDDGAANGIYRLKVYTSVDVAELDTVELATKPGVMPTLPESVNAWTEDGALVSVPVTWDTLTEDMIAADGEVKLNGINSATGLMTTATIYVRSDMDKATISTVYPVEVATDAGVVPNLPKTVKVMYNNGAYNMVPVTWETITSEDVSTPGEVTFEGEVEGTTTKAKVTVTVNKVEVNKSVLEKAIAAAKELKAADYTADSFAPITAALEAAEAVLADENATQKQVNDAAGALETAMAGKVGIKDALNQAIAKAEALKEEAYKPDTWVPLAEALEAAKAVLAKEEVTEEEANEAVAALEDAMAGLVKTGEVKLTLNLKFEKPEDITVVKDSSENAFDSTATGITEEDYIEGVNGTALHFNGDTSYDIPAGSALAAEDVTLSYWIKRTDDLSGDNPILWAKKDSTWNGNGFYTNYPTNDAWSSFVCMDGFTGFYVDEAPNEFLPQDEWVHVAVTWDSVSKTGKIYKNGVEQEVSYLDTPVSITGEEDAANRMGDTGYSNGPTNNLALDEFKIYNGAMDAEGIKALYKEFDEASSLTLDLKFEKPEDLSVVKDSSENAFDSTATGITEEDYIEGVSGTALHFNGDTKYDIPAGAALASENVSLSYWIKRTGELSGDNPILWAKKDSTWNGDGFYTNYPAGDKWSSLVVMDGFNGFYVDEEPNSFLPLDEWTHVAVTWDSVTKTGKIYKNGVEQEVSILDSPTSITGVADAANRMGDTGYSNGPTNNLALDEFQIYSKAISADDVKALYEALKPEEAELNYGALQALVDEAKAIDTSKYTEESVAALNDAVADAEAILAEGADTQEAIDAMTDAVQAAINGLSEVIIEVVDKTALADAIADAEALKSDDYTGTSWAALTTALQNAEYVYNNEEATKGEVESVTSALLAAIEALEEKPAPSVVDFTKLTEVYESIKDLNADMYTDESWAVLYDAANRATALMNNPNATQAEVDAMVEELRAAKDALVADEGYNPPVEPEKPEKPENKPSKDEDGAVKTGDNAPVALMATIMIVALAAIVFVLVQRRRTSR